MKQDLQQKTTEISKHGSGSPERRKDDRAGRQTVREAPRYEVNRVTESQSTNARKTPERVLSNRVHQESERTERKESTYSYTERKISSDHSSIATVIRRSQTPEKRVQKVSPEKEKPIRTIPETKSGKTEMKESFTKLKKTVPVPGKQSVEDDKPDWVKQRNLRKTSETSAPVIKKTTTSKTSSTTRTETVRNSPVRDTRSTDLITSSYGVGPTDENGTPLFGLRALRAQSKGKTVSMLFNR